MRRMRLIIVAVSLVVALAMLTAWLIHVSHRRTATTVRLFFPQSSLPASMRLVAHGSQRSIFGDGSFVIAFTIADAEFNTMMDAGGFVPIGTEEDPNHWRLELCNEVIARVADVGVKITPEFTCFSKESAANRQRTRVYYDKQQQLAIGISFIGSKRGPG